MPTTSAADQVTDRTRSDSLRYVDPSTSGPWCAARPSTTVVVLDRLDEHHDLLADALLGPLGGELLGQPGDVLDPVADLVLVELAVERRGLGAVLVGVAEDADRVEPGRLEEVAERREVVLGLAGEADDEVGADARLGRLRADLVEQREEASESPNRRIRRSSGPDACWKERSKYGATPGVEAIARDQAGPGLGRLEVGDPHALDALDRGELGQQRSSRRRSPRSLP